MKMTQEGALYQLSFMPRLFPVNCYLIEEQDELTLIDCALPYSAQGILRAAKQIGKPIRSIVLTHAHNDHVGALDALKQALPDVRVYLSARDTRLLAGDLSLQPHEPQSPIRGGIPSKLRTRPDVQLQDGDRIGSLQAVAAPGHTPGSMAFLDLRSRALIAGDAFQLRGGIAVSGKVMPWFPFPALATWHPGVALESAIRLAALHPSLLAVGHGSFLKQPLQAMKQAIAEAEASLKKIDAQGGGSHIS